MYYLKEKQDGIEEQITSQVKIHNSLEWQIGADHQPLYFYFFFVSFALIVGSPCEHLIIELPHCVVHNQGIM